MGQDGSEWVRKGQKGSGWVVLGCVGLCWVCWGFRDTQNNTISHKFQNNPYYCLTEKK
jgi:hypothetical protein